MKEKKTLIINGRETEFGDEKNLLEVIRKAGIEIPTFCYHSELSVYGACRLCIVDVEGRGIVASCSMPPESGMKVKTDTAEIREIRKINVELLLANHNRECPTCSRSSSCALQDIARRLGIEEVRYKQRTENKPIDNSSAALTRDPNKCVLCGDCVRFCKEVQGVGAIDFIHRGVNAQVAPAFDQDLSSTECVGCGQCAAVCPTGAIVPRQDRENVWNVLHDENTVVVAQIAPAVRVALGEYFGCAPGDNVAGKLVAALKMMGFDHVYDTCFAADMTILEEGTEFINRLTGGYRLPLFTSCCPAWVKFAEIYYPELMGNLSSCKSPQQMFGAVAKEMLPKKLDIPRGKLSVVSIMPCTAKKSEARLGKFSVDGNPDVDHVLTTLELGRMISSMGIQFNELEPEAFDMPLGFSTGAGLIFGASGGVMEAALRYAVEKVTGKTLDKVDFNAVRGDKGIREATLDVAGKTVKVAVVHGLANARKVAEDVANGKCEYDFIEVMSCPGGCVSGAGQPIAKNDGVRKKRANGLYQGDRNMQLRKSQDNYFVDECYEKVFEGRPGCEKAHHSLHTKYQNRSQIFDAKMPVLKGEGNDLVPITVTICASQEDCPGKNLLARIVRYVKDNKWDEKVNVEAAFSSRNRLDGTICVTVGEENLDNCEFMNARNTEEEVLNQFAFDRIRKAIDKLLV